MSKKLLLTALLCCMFNIGYAQLQLKGKVVDETNRPISDASIRVENSTIGTLSDANGNFILKNVPDGTHTLRVSGLDYSTERQEVNSSKEDLLFKLSYSYLNLNEVVITGTGTHHRVKNTPIPTEVLSRREIVNTGALTFEDALSSLSTSVATKGSGFIVGGLGNKNVLILVDGQKLAGDTGGDNDLSRIDMSNVKRIEVVKGAASSLYGSDAMGGVINIITNKPENKIDITSTRRFAQHGQWYESANVGLNLGKFTSLTSYQHTKNKGWKLSDYEISSKGKITETDKQAVTAFKSDVISQKFTYSPVKAVTVYTQGGFYQKKTDRAFVPYSYNMKYKDYNMAVGGTYRLKNNTDYIRFDTYFDNYSYGKVYFKDASDGKAGDDIMTKRQRYTNSTLKGVFRLGEYNKLNVGLDYVNDYMKNPGSIKGESASKSAYTLAAYAQDEYKINRFTIIPGFRFVHHEMFKNRFSPKLAVMYGLDHFNFRASYASGFRAPNIQELYYEKESSTMISEGNPNLKPEKSNYYSLNAEYTNDFMSVSVTGFINDVENIIDRANLPLTPEEEANGLKNHYKYMNVSKARIRGVDFSLTAYITNGLTMGAGYSYLDPKNRIDDIRLFGTSHHTGTANVNWRKAWSKYLFNVNFNGRLQSNAYYPKSNEHQNNIARTYQLWNLATRHTFSGVKSFTPELGLGVENIFNFKDRKDFGHRYANTTPGRTFYASVILNFKK